MRIPTVSVSRRGHRASVALASLLVVTALSVTACRGILSVDLPTRVSAGVLDDASFAPTMVNGAIADFDCAYTNYTGATGLLTDELIEQAGEKAGGMTEPEADVHASAEYRTHLSKVLTRRALKEAQTRAH